MFYECLFSEKPQLLASNATFSLVIVIKERNNLQKKKEKKAKINKICKSVQTVEKKFIILQGNSHRWWDFT